jgi:hypothetical protein
VSGMRTLVVVAVAGCAVGVASSATGVLGSRDLTPAASPAHVVIAGSGHAGVFTVRDGALTRLDRQSPPGRLLIPPPRTGPVATAIAVGALRAWIDRGSVISGYSTDPGSPDPVWSVRVSAISRTSVLASSGRWLWVGDPRTGRVFPIDVRERTTQHPAGHLRGPVVGAPFEVAGRLVGCAAVPDGLWVVSRTPGGGSEITRVVAGHRSGESQVISRVDRAPIAITAAGWSLAVLVRGQVLRIDGRSHRVIQRLSVPFRATAISASAHAVVVSNPGMGTIVDIPWRRPAARIVVRVERPARALVATPAGFWVAVGPDATPTEYQLP